MTTTPAAPVAPAPAPSPAPTSSGFPWGKVTRPLGGAATFGLGIASFVVPSLHSGLGTPFGVALIVAGAGVFHVTVNSPSA